MVRRMGEQCTLAGGVKVHLSIENPDQLAGKASRKLSLSPADSTKSSGSKDAIRVRAPTLSNK